MATLTIATRAGWRTWAARTPEVCGRPGRGRLAGEQWDRAVAVGRRALYEPLFADAKEALEECDRVHALVAAGLVGVGALLAGAAVFATLVRAPPLNRALSFPPLYGGVVVGLGVVLLRATRSAAKPGQAAAS